VQDASSIRSDIPKNLPALSSTASRLYTRWIENLRE